MGAVSRILLPIVSYRIVHPAPGFSNILGIKFELPWAGSNLSLQHSNFFAPAGPSFFHPKYIFPCNKRDIPPKGRKHRQHGTYREIYNTVITAGSLCSSFKRIVLLRKQRKEKGMKIIVVKKGSYKERKTGLYCCGYGPSGRN